MKRLLLLALPTILFSCNDSKQEDLTEKSKQEILQAEKDFAQLVKIEGIVKGFTKYAAPNAVIKQEDGLIKGPSEIEKYYTQRKTEGHKLEWTAEYVDAAASGELGYTYGHYVYSLTDSAGKPVEYKGNFHTVWKKQPDGNWKFVWD